MQAPSTVQRRPFRRTTKVGPEPYSYSEALASRDAKDWGAATDREYNRLHDIKTLGGKEDPKGGKVIGAKWVYKWKTNEFGEVVKAKARLIAKGFSQRKGIDYFETFSPTPSTSSIRLLAAIAC